MNEDIKAFQMPLKTGILMTVAIIVLVAIMVVGMNALGVSMWIPFLGLSLWAAFGMPMGFKEIASLWTSVAAALTIGYMINNMQTIGLPAIIIAAVGILLLIFGMTTKRMSFIFNNYMGVFVCAGTAGIPIDPVPAVKSVIFGFVVIGLLPYYLSKLAAKKKAEKTS